MTHTLVHSNHPHKMKALTNVHREFAQHGNSLFNVSPTSLPDADLLCKIRRYQSNDIKLTDYPCSRGKMLLQQSVSFSRGERR